MVAKQEFITATGTVKHFFPIAFSSPEVKAAKVRSELMFCQACVMERLEGWGELVEDDDSC